MFVRASNFSVWFAKFWLERAAIGLSGKSFVFFRTASGQIVVLLRRSQNLSCSTSFAIVISLASVAISCFRLNFFTCCTNRTITVSSSNTSSNSQRSRLNSLMETVVAVLRRLFIWATIPWRLFMEIYLCWYPPLEKGSENDAKDTKAELFVDREQEAFWQAQGDRDGWWGPKATMSGLKKFNPIRLRLVAEGYLKEVLGLEATWEEMLRTDAKALIGARICDVGCGAGIFTEVLAEAGASVVGIDVTNSAIESAKLHWKETYPDFDATLVTPEYHCMTLQDFIEYSHEHFDIVVCSDVLEHVTNPQEFAALCCQLVKPGGCIVFSTINRTIFSLLWNMIMFEDVLGICARWLHRLYLCVKPEEVRQVTDRLNYKTMKTVGLVWQPLSLNFLNNAGKFNWTETWFTGCAYAVLCKHQP